MMSCLVQLQEILREILLQVLSEASAARASELGLN